MGYMVLSKGAGGGKPMAGLDGGFTTVLVMQGWHDVCIMAYHGYGCGWGVLLGPMRAAQQGISECQV
jgi:hypothetical protein